MRKIHEEIQDHIHSNLCSRVNEFIINLKIHYMDISEESAEQQAKIGEARRRKPEPTWNDMIELLTDIRDEMDKCTQPYRRY